MTQTPKPVSPPPMESEPTQTAPTPLSEKEAHRLDLETEQDARRQARVGQIVRGGGGQAN